jgi:hypothetical protein
VVKDKIDEIDVRNIKIGFVPLEKIDTSNEIAKMQEIRRRRQEKERLEREKKEKEIIICVLLPSVLHFVLIFEQIFVLHVQL